MTANCPECNKKFISTEFMEKHADTEHPDWRVPKSKGWCTPYGFVDFATPVTYEHACAVMKEAMPELEAMKAGRD